jgi:Zn-finger nucleic acid-binding protein
MPADIIPRMPLEARLPCPVCLGVQMEKVQVGQGAGLLTLDHCTRCGGVWFEKGEPQRLTRFTPAQLAAVIPPRKAEAVTPCHGCSAPLDRDAERCAACGTENVLRCPACDRKMQRVTQDGVTVDVCARCKGVWFDHAELRHVWTLAVERWRPDGAGRGRNAVATGADVLLESFFWAPGLTIHATGAAVEGIGAAAGALGSVSAEGAAHAALAGAEAVGGAAEGVFSFILELIGSIFDN